MSARMKLSSVYSSLPPAERKVADFILSDPDAASRMIINDIAHGAGVSLPSVTRLAKKLGYDGFMDFRVALARSRSTIHNVIDNAPASTADSDQAFIHKLMIGQMRAMESTLRILDKAAFCELADRMIAAGRILWFGVGNSLSIAANINDFLIRIGIVSLLVNDTCAIRTYASGVSGSDVCFGISRTGQTRRTIDCLRTAKECGAYTVLITNDPASPAKDFVDSLIQTSRLDDLYRLCGAEANAAQKALLEVLAALIAKKTNRLGEDELGELLSSDN